MYWSSDPKDNDVKVFGVAEVTASEEWPLILHSVAGLSDAS